MDIIGLETPVSSEKYLAPKTEDTSPFWIPEYGKTHLGTPCYQLRLNSPLSCFQYVISGSGVLLCNGRLLTVKTGDSFYLPAGTDHIYYSGPDHCFSRLWINVTGPLCKALAEVYGISGHVVFPDCDTSLLLSRLHTLCAGAKTPEEYKQSTAPVFLELIQHLAAHRSNAPHPPAPVEEIRLYLDRHIRENPKLSDIAAHFSFSPEHLIRLFRKTYGITPHRYILQSRIRMAMILLRTTNTPVSRISDQLGFSDPHHFSAAFQLSVGLRPSAYRKQENT